MNTNDRISRYFKHEGGLMFEDKIKIPLGIVWRAALVMGRENNQKFWLEIIRMTKQDKRFKPSRSQTNLAERAPRHRWLQANSNKISRSILG